MWAFDCPRDQREKCHLYIVKGKLCRSLKIPGKIPSFSCPEQPNWLLVSQVETWPKQTRYVVPQGQGGRQGCLNGSGGTSGVSPRSRGASGVSDWLNKHPTDPRAPLTWQWKIWPLSDFCNYLFQSVRLLKNYVGHASHFCSVTLTLTATNDQVLSSNFNFL